MADIINGGPQINDDDENLEMSSESETMAESRRKLRCHWELASVLNFFRVFEPVIGKEVKMSAEDIETALILSNHSLAKLHITLLKDRKGRVLILESMPKGCALSLERMPKGLALSLERMLDGRVLRLKKMPRRLSVQIGKDPKGRVLRLERILKAGIPPVNKNLSNPDAWVTVLCKKLAEWWPWVAEGKVPLTAEKGEEISKYKELEPTIRLSMLKALCELRIEQVDLMSYVNDELKKGKDISHFRVDKISENRKGISYWYDGNSVMGYRLYKEVNKPHTKSKYKGKGCINLPPTISEWETLATNLDEFRKFSEELSSSSDAVEGSVYQAIETEVIPALEKLKKKQEMVLKRKEREEARLNNYCPYVAVRTCRTRKPVKYTFDDYDQAIEEAIKVTREGKDRKVERTGKKLHENGKRGSHSSNGEMLNDAHMEEGSPDSVDEDEPNDIQVEESDIDDSASNNEEITDTDSDASNSSLENVKRDTLDSQGQNDLISNGPKTKDNSDSSSGHHSPRAKNRLRQRPTKNSALEPCDVPDSDTGSASDNADSEDDPSQVADSEDEMSS
ncbi:hypothetical protein KSS87_013487 [Heliosperma pusillum]|nr:hypothetical protein KSS87_013487 [Heliosperma pusillum]